MQTHTQVTGGEEEDGAGCEGVVVQVYSYSTQVSGRRSKGGQTLGCRAELQSTEGKRLRGAERRGQERCKGGGRQGARVRTHTWSWDWGGCGNDGGVADPHPGEGAGGSGSWGEHDLAHTS